MLEFLGANLLDDKPFIVTPYLENGNARVFIENHPECNRLKIVCDKLMINLQQKSQTIISAVRGVTWSSVSSFKEYHTWRSQSGNEPPLEF